MMQDASIPNMDFLSTLAQQQSSLPKSQQRVLQVILDNPQQAVSSTVEMIAHEAQVSLPTVIRTVRSFGFDSVREFMVSLAQNIAITNYIHRNISSDDDLVTVKSNIIQSALSTIYDLENTVDMQLIDQVATRIVQCTRIDAYSVGSESDFIAAELTARLFRLGIPAHPVRDFHQQLISASSLGVNGIAFAISHVGRMPSLLKVVALAKQNNTPVVALTQADTPLAKLADHVISISVPNDVVMRVSTEAYLAHLLIIEMLSIRITQKLGPAVNDKLAAYKKTLLAHGVDNANL